MLTHGKRKVLPAALLSLAAAHAASAAVDYTISPTPLASPTAGYTALGSSVIKATPNGLVAGTENKSYTETTHTTDLDGFDVTVKGNYSATMIWATNASGQQIVIGYGLDSNGKVDTSSTVNYSNTYRGSFDVINNATTVNATVTNNLVAISSAGAVIGNTARYGTFDWSKVGDSSVTNLRSAGLGQEAWVYLPSPTDVASNSASTTVVTPKSISLTDTKADSNNITTAYYFTLSTGLKSYSSSAIAINSSNTIIGSSSRYTGTTASNAVGTDVWIYDPNTGNQKLLGLGVSSATPSGTYYSYNSTIGGTVYQNRTSSAVAVNDNGWVVGTTSRYSSTGSGMGNDAWVYNGNDTYQVGIVGDNIPYSDATPNTYTNSSGTRSSSVFGVNANNQVGGTTTKYTQYTYYLVDSKTGVRTPTTGQSTYQEAWMYYAPQTGAGGTGTSYTTLVPGSTPQAGSYIRIGLQDVVSNAFATSMGHQASWGGSSNIFAMNQAGQAAGTSTRYQSDDLAGFEVSRGADAWYYDGKGVTINISPIAANTVDGVTYNASGVKINGTGKSNYVSTATYTYLASSAKYGATTNSYFASSSVVAMNALGWVAGTIGRYNGASTAGYDSWIYDATGNELFVLTAPNIQSASDSGNLQVKALSATGLAVGFYYLGSTQYLFTWTEQNGMQTLSALTGLTDALANDAGWLSLSNALVLADANGTLYGLGNTVSNVNGVWEITAAAVPEPASLSMLMLGAMLLMSRRGKSRA